MAEFVGRHADVSTVIFAFVLLAFALAAFLEYTGTIHIADVHPAMDRLLNMARR